MNLKSISDAKPNRNWKSTLTGGLTEGKPTETNLYDFREIVESQADQMLTEGRIKVKGNVCLGVKVQLPSKIVINSCNEPLELIGTFLKGEDLIGLYRPASGWRKGNQAEEL